MRSITDLSQPDPNGTYTYADYLLWKFEERVALLRGKIARLTVPSRAHQAVSINLSTLFMNALCNSLCKVYTAPFDVRLPRQADKEVLTVVQPAICVICDPSKLDDRGCLGRPILLLKFRRRQQQARNEKQVFYL